MKKKSKVWLIVVAGMLLMSGLPEAKAQQQKYTKTGYASFYADKFEGKATASGEKYYHAKQTAAHKTLPFGTIVKVTNLSNNKTVAVRINDRGPNVPDRLIDLSRSAAKKLGMLKQGIARVRIEVIDSMEDRFQNDQQTKKKKLYRFAASEMPSEGYGIQLGSFRKLENLVRATNKMESSSGKHFYIEIAEVNQEEIIRLFYGNFSTRREADLHLSTVRRTFPDGFIVKF